MNEFYAMLVQKDCVVALFRYRSIRAHATPISPWRAQYGFARALCSLCSIRARFVGYVLTVVARIRRHAPVAASFGHSRNR